MEDEMEYAEDEDMIEDAEDDVEEVDADEDDIVGNVLRNIRRSF